MTLTLNDLLMTITEQGLGDVDGSVSTRSFIMYARAWDYWNYYLNNLCSFLRTFGIVNSELLSKCYNLPKKYINLLLNNTSIFKWKANSKYFYKYFAKSSFGKIHLKMELYRLAPSLFSSQCPSTCLRMNENELPKSQLKKLLELGEEPSEQPFLKLNTNSI